MVAEWERRVAQGKEVEASIGIGLGAGRGFTRVNQCWGMVEDAEQIHIGDMKKSPRVTFKMQRIAEGDWQIVAECPGAETQYIKGLKSKEEVDEWLAGTRRIAWLRSQGYAK
jgi:hypothetical protein